MTGFIGLGSWRFRGLEGENVFSVCSLVAENRRRDYIGWIGLGLHGMEWIEPGRASKDSVAELRLRLRRESRGIY